MGTAFLSIDEQVALLESRGVEVDPSTPDVLRAENYYSVVNGYKVPFIDRQVSSEAGDDRYVEGTRFSDIYSVFRFDRALRAATFARLIPVEAMVRSSCAHRFAEAHRGPADYLNADSYTDASEYILGAEDHADNLAGIIGTLTRRSADRENRIVFVDHYRDEYGEVPIWVLANDLTFGEIKRFFTLMREREQIAVCRDIVTLTGRIGDRELGYLNPSEAFTAIDLLVKVRNACGHDSRLYCGRFGPHREAGYREFLTRLRRFVTHEVYEDFLTEVQELIDTYSAHSELVASALAEANLLP